MSKPTQSKPSRNNTRSRLKRAGAKPMALEQRIMFDGAAVVDAVAVAMLSEKAQPTQVETPASEAVQTDAGTAVDTGSTGTTSAPTTDAIAQGAYVPQAVRVSESTGLRDGRREIAFVDAGIQDRAELIARIPSALEVVVVQQGGDGLAQIAEFLGNSDQHYDAIHVLGHGRDNALTVGSVELTDANVDQFAQSLQRIGASLNQGGDILLYACDLTSGSMGAELTARIAEQTGADVAASRDTTGSAAAGGNWVLETQVGEIQTQALQFDNYDGTLAPLSGAGNALYNNLGGGLGFGENAHFRNDDSPTGAINITSVFGSSGVRFGNTNYTNVFINNNGMITFGSAFGGYTPNGLRTGVNSGGGLVPAIALYWTDLDTRNTGNLQVAGGNSRGSNLVYWDLDTTSAVKSMTVTWDDVGEYSNGNVSRIAGQIRMWSVGNGDLDFELRYEYVADNLASHSVTAGWNTGVANGTLGTHYFEIPNRTGTSAGGTGVLGDLDTRASNTGQVGSWYFGLRGGSVINADASGNINAPPTITAGSASGSEDGTVTLGSSVFTARYTDPEATALSKIKITSLATNGTLRLNGTAVTLNQEITRAQLDGNQLTFQPNANFNGNASFGWAASDGSAYSGNSTITIAVSAVNDAPVASGSATLAAVGEDSAAPAGASVTSLFTGTFSDSADTVSGGSTANTLAGVVLTGNAATASQGVWEYSTNSGSSWTAVGTSVSQAAGLALPGTALLRFRPAAEFNGAPGALTAVLVESSGSVTAGATVDVSTRGGTTALSSSTVALNTTITAVNDAPVLTSGAPVFTDITEDNLTSAGRPVSSFLTTTASSGTASGVSDVDAGALTGIAVTATTGSGTWQYSLNAGSTWNAFGTVSATTSLLLRSTDQVRFVPNGATPTSATFTYRAWDQSSGTAGTMVSTATTGGTTAFSSASDSASIAVTAVNDAPVLGGTVSTLAYTEGTTARAIDTVLTLTDPDGTAFANATARVSITGNYLSAQDVLSVLNIGSGTGQVGVSGSTISFQGVAVGTIDAQLNGQYNASTNTAGVLAINFNSAATTAAAQAVLRAVAYANTSNAPDVNTRTVSFVVNDAGNSGAGTALDSATRTASVTITPVDNPVTLTLSRGSSASYNENDNSFFVDANLTLSDPDSPTYNGGAKVVISSNFVSAQDSLRVATGSRASGATVTYSGTSGTWTLGGRTISYTYSSSTGVMTLATTAGTTTYDDYQDALRAVTYFNSSDTPNTTARGIDVVLGNTVSLTFNGQTHYYEYVAVSGGINWTNSKTAAAARTLNGLTGYLATLTSATENAFVTQKLGADAWIGASDDFNQINAATGVTTFANQSAAEGRWYWVTGPEKGQLISTGNGSPVTATNGYANWNTGEPNNVGGSGENYGEIYSSGGIPGRWNDLPNVNLSGYVVEYSDASGMSTFSRSYTLNVVPVNDAPVTSGSANFTTITEDSVSNSGDLVSGIVNATDIDGVSTTAIAVTGLTGANGRWQYSLDNGAIWTDVGSVSDSNALLLRAADRLRFVPAAGNTGGSAVVTFRAWDRSNEGTESDISTPFAGRYADASTSGGSSAYSASTRTGNLTISSINDAPVLTAGTTDLATVNSTVSTAAPYAITEDSTSNAGLKVSDVLGTSVSDADASPLSGIAITSSVAGNGTWQYFNSTTSTWVSFTAAGGITEQSSLLLKSTDIIRLLPNGQSGTTAGFTFRAWDQTTGTGYGRASTTVNGATTAFSSQAASATLTVTDLNDAPVLGTTTASLAPLSEEDISSAGQTIGSLLASQISDNDPGAIKGVAITGATGIASSTGKWQYLLASDLTQTWTDLPSVTSSAALLLGVQDRVRFLPDQYYSGTPTLTMNAWDQSDSATAGSVADASGVGGITAFSSQSATVSVSVIAVNDAPRITAGRDDTAFTEGGADSPVDTAFALEDDGSGNTIRQATITISAGFTAGDTLTASTLPTGITASYSASSGILTLSGNASAADYQSAIRSVRFGTTSDDLTDIAAARTLTVRVIDTASAAGADDDSVVSVEALLDAPVTDLAPQSVSSDNNLNYVEESGPRIVAPLLTLSDVDDVNLSGAVVEISGAGFDATFERLSIAGQTLVAGGPAVTVFDNAGTANDITVTYSSTAMGATLTFSGEASISQYQQVLRRVTYDNTTDYNHYTVGSTLVAGAVVLETSGSGQNNTRTVTWTVTDANSDDAATATSPNTPQSSVVRSTAITLINANEEPAVDDADLNMVTFDESVGAVPVVADSLLLIDGNGQTVETATATKAVVTINRGFSEGDVLSVAADSNATGFTHTVTAGTPANGVQVDTISVTGPEIQTFAGSDLDVTNHAGALYTLTFTPDDGVTAPTVISAVVDGSPTLAELAAALRANLAYPLAAFTIVADNTNGTLKVVSKTAGDMGGVSSIVVTDLVAQTPASLTQASTTPSDPETQSFSSLNLSGVAGAVTTYTFTPTGGGAPVLLLTTLDSTPTVAELLTGLTTGANATAYSALPFTLVNDSGTLRAVSKTAGSMGGAGSLDFVTTNPLTFLSSTLTETPVSATAIREVQTLSGLNAAGSPAALVNLVFTPDTGSVLSAFTLSTRLDSDPTLAEVVTELTTGANALDYAAAPFTLAVVGSDIVAINKLTGLIGGTVGIDVTQYVPTALPVIASTSAIETATLSATYDSNAGELTLETSTPATFALFQSVLRSVVFDSTSDDPSATAATRLVGWQIYQPDTTVTSGTPPLVPSLVNSGSQTQVNIIADNDASVVQASGTSSANTAVFVEDGSAVAVAANLRITDSDDTVLNRADIEITNAQTGDVLAIDAAVLTRFGLTLDVSSTNDHLIITGEQSVANYQSALRQVTFATSDQDGSVARNVNIRVTDVFASRLTDSDSTLMVNNDADTGSQSSASPTTITVARTNDAPALAALTSAGSVFTEGSSVVAVPLISSTTPVAAGDLSDSDNSVYSAITAQMNRGLTDGDQLGILVGSTLVTSGSVYIDASNQLSSLATGAVAEFSVSYSSADGLLTVSAVNNAVTAAQMAIALNGIGFANSGDDPSSIAGTRTIGIAVVDAGSNDDLTSTDAVSSALRTVSVDIEAQDDAPTLSGLTGSSVSFTENGSPVQLDGSITLTDADDTQLAGATLTISAGFTSGDELRVTAALAGSSISAAYDASTGILTLTGTASVADYRSVIESVYFSSSSDNPTGSSANRTITYALQSEFGSRLTDAASGNDATSGVVNASAGSVTVTITPVNDAPGLSISSNGVLDSTTYVFQQGGSPAFLSAALGTVVPGSLTVSDPDTTTLASAQIVITRNSLATDTLSVATPSGWTVAGSVYTHTASGQAVTVTYNSGSSTLSFAGTALLARYQELLANARFSNSSTAPTANGASREFTWTVNDGALSNTAITYLTIRDVNDAPQATTTAASASYTEGASGVALPDIVAVDPDTGERLTATLQLQDAAGGALTDASLFGALSQPTGSTYDATTGIWTVSGTVTAVNTALAAVTFTPNLNNDRALKLAYTIADGGEDSAQAASGVIDLLVTPTPDATSISVAPTLPIIEGDSVVVGQGLTLSDLDTGGTLSTVAVRITTGLTAGDTLGFTADPATMGNIQGTYNAVTGLLTLNSASNSATLAQWQAALRSISYSSSDSDPTRINASGVAQAPTRAITWLAVGDDGLSSALQTTTLNFTAVNSAPVLGSGSALSYTEDQSPQAIAPSMTLGDDLFPTGNLFGSTLTVRIDEGAGEFVAGDRLSILNVGNSAGQVAFNAVNGVVSVGGVAVGVAQFADDNRSLQIDFSRIGSLGPTVGSAVTQSAVQTVLRNIAYSTDSNSPSTDPRSVSFLFDDNAGTANGGQSQGTAVHTVSVTPVNDAPAGSLSASGVAALGQDLTVVDTVTDGEGTSLPRNYSWQISRDGISGWTSISGADQSTFTPGVDQVGYFIRPVLTYTDDGGTTETVFGNSSTDRIAYDASLLPAIAGSSDPFTLAGGEGDDSIVTGTGNDRINLDGFPEVGGNGGDDVVDAGDGDDSIGISADDLTSGDSLDGGNGRDTLDLTTAGTVADTAFDNLTSIETLTLASGTNDITLGSNAADAGLDSVQTGTGDDRVDARTFTGNLDVALSSGDDEILLGGGDDRVTINVNDLSSLDTINGGNGNDTLVISGPGTLSDTALANVTGFETLIIADDVEVILGPNAENVPIRHINGTPGDNDIDLSQYTGPVTVEPGTGNDSIRLGAGDDLLRMPIEALTLDDVIDAGAGHDTLEFITAGENRDESFVGVSNLEALQLADGRNNLVLGMLAQTAGVREITGGSDADRLSLEHYTASVTIVTADGTDDVTLGSGSDSVDLGADSDTLHVDTSRLTAADTLTGGAGDDTLDVSGGGQLTDAQLVNVSSFETLSLSGDNASAVLGPNADAAGIRTINAGGTDNLIDVRNMTSDLAIDAGDGDDTVLLGNGDDTLTAGDGNDSISLAGGDDSVDAGDGDDALSINLSDLTAGDTLVGGDGNDTLYIAGPGTLSDAQMANIRGFENIVLGPDVQVVLGPNADAIPVTQVDGTPGDDVLDASGMTRGITVNPGFGNDSIRLGSGDDLLRMPIEALTIADTIDAGDGRDTLTFITAGSNTDDAFTNVRNLEVVQLADGGNTLTLGSNAQTAGVRELNGGSGDDVVDLQNYTADVSVAAGDGADDLTLGSGDDSIGLGNGDDIVRMRNGRLTADDTLDGGAGSDTLQITDAGELTDTQLANVRNFETLDLIGTDASAVLGDNAMLSGITNITSGPSNNRIDARDMTRGLNIDTGDGDDTVLLGDGDDTLAAGDGSDLIELAGGDDSVDAGNGDDRIEVDLSNLNADDTIVGGDGEDTLFIRGPGVLTDAQLANIRGFEHIVLGEGVRVVLGPNAQAVPIREVIGTNGNDDIDASAFTSGLTVEPGFGDDSIVLGSGDDLLRMPIEALTIADTIDAGDGTDTLTFITAGQNSDESFTHISNLEVVQLADGVNTLTIGENADAAGVLSVLGGSGDDTVNVDSYVRDLQIELADGDDTLSIEGDNLDATDSVDAGAGTDTLILRSADPVSDAQFSALRNFERLVLTDGDKQISLGSAFEAAGFRSVRSGDGNDLIDASAAQNGLPIEAGGGDDTLIGSQADDTLDGGDGLDIVRYEGRRADYRIERISATEWLITGLSGPNAGITDRLLNVEQIVFASGDVQDGLRGDESVDIDESRNQAPVNLVQPRTAGDERTPETAGELAAIGQTLSVSALLRQDGRVELLAQAADKANDATISESATGLWYDPDFEAGDLVYSYQWEISDIENAQSPSTIRLIDGAVDSDYTPGIGDVGRYIRIRVTADDGAGGRTDAVSAWKQVVNSKPEVTQAVELQRAMDSSLFALDLDPLFITDSDLAPAGSTAAQAARFDSLYYTATLFNAIENVTRTVEVVTLSPGEIEGVLLELEAQLPASARSGEVSWLKLYVEVDEASKRPVRAVLGGKPSGFDVGMTTITINGFDHDRLSDAGAARNSGTEITDDRASPAVFVMNLEVAPVPLPPQGGPTVLPTGITVGMGGPVNSSSGTPQLSMPSAWSSPTGDSGSATLTVRPAADSTAMPSSMSLAPQQATGLTRADGFQVIVAAKSSGGDQTTTAPKLQSSIETLGTQTARGNDILKVTVPREAFTHTRQDAVVKLEAMQVDNQPLPPWVTFDAAKGEFTAQVPPDFVGELTVKVIAKDNFGNEVSVTFVIKGDGAAQKVSERSISKPVVAKAGLSAQLRDKGYASLGKERSGLVELARMAVNRISKGA